MLLPDINIAIFKFHGKYTFYNIAAHQPISGFIQPLNNL